MLPRVEVDTGPRTLAAPSSGNREVDSAWDHIREPVKVEGALVGHNCFRVSEWEPGRDYMLVCCRGEVPQPVETGADALKAPSRAGMMAKGSSRHTCLERLLGREVASLRLRKAIEGVMIQCSHTFRRSKVGQNRSRWSGSSLGLGE